MCERSIHVCLVYSFIQHVIVCHLSFVVYRCRVEYM